MDLLIFDMDGVLVDVTESYRETICATVKHFTGAEITKAQIQDWKNQGGWNDDWRLSQHMIRQAGLEVDLETVIQHFQTLFHGSNGTEGLILRERWIARKGLFERLGGRFQLAVFTGRLRWEAEFTLQRFAPELAFAPIVGSDDVARLKPFPDGLLKICAGAPGCKAWYVGDTRDDGLSAQAAGVPFIGIASPANPRYAELKRSLQETGAVAVLEDINQLETVLGE
jgi:HAD superfamily hydrolase (TIGR01548 family)